MADHFAGIARKVEQARTHLANMGRVILRPCHRPAGQTSMPVARLVDVYHVRHDQFDAEVNAFLSATRSVPDLITYRFGLDRPEKNVWLNGPDPGERQRRRRFARKFERSF